MILSLESYSAVIIRLDLSRDCPPYDPVTPLKPLGLSWASVLPLCRLIGPQLIYLLLLLLWLLLWLYYVWSAAYAPMPRPHPSSGSGQCHLWPCEKFHFRSSVQSFEYSTEIFDCCRIDLSLCWATNSPQLMITMFILCDGWRVATMPKRIEDVEMVTTETDREARDRERWCRRRIDNNPTWMEGGTGVCCRDSKARQATKLLLCFLLLLLL